MPFALAFLLSPAAFAADTPAAELLRQAEAERPAYLDTLRQLVAVDSGTGQAEGLGQLSALLAERLQALGAQVRSAPATPSAGDNLVATLDGTGSKRFLLMIHYDTVFAAGSAAKRPFREDAERAYGPGVADAKGGVAVVLHALALLRQQGFRDYGRITVLFNPDEETGSAGSKQLIAELARQQDYVFSYEPPDRDAVTVATNGIDGLLLEVKGRSSHAGSAPEQGRNAILELSHQLLRLKDLGDPAKGTTLNWTLARGGEKRNIIPAEASAEADMRYSDPAESERVLADARKLTGERLVADTEVSLRLDKGRPPLVKNPPRSAWRKPHRRSTAESASASSRSPCASARTPATPTCPAATNRRCWKPSAWSAPACTARRNTSNYPASPPPVPDGGADPRAVRRLAPTPAASLRYGSDRAPRASQPCVP